MEKPIHNLHIPLPDALYQELERVAAHTGQPLTEVAREAIWAFVRERERQRLHQEILAYAEATGGADEDLDPDVEAASTEHLLETRDP